MSDELFNLLRDLGEFRFRSVEVASRCVDVDSHVVADFRWCPKALGEVAEHAEMLQEAG
jgi:hypothetical protein